MTAPVRIAVIGGAFGRSAIAPAYTRHRACAVVDVISSRDPAEVAAACRRPDVDLVSVHAAPHQHRAIVDRVLDAGKHVVCDKPFGASLADAEHLAARAATHPGLAAITFEFRYQPWRRGVRELLASGALGELESVDWLELHTAWRTRTGGWQLSRADGGGWLGAMAAHIIDTLAWWTRGNADPSLDVLAAGLDGDPAAGVAERAGELVLRLGAARASVVTRGASSFTSGPRVVVAGSRGAVEAADTLTLHGVEWPDGVTQPSAGSTFPDLLDAWCDDVVHAVTDGPRPDLATFADGLAWARVRHAALGLVASRPANRPCERDDPRPSGPAAAQPGSLS